MNKQTDNHFITRRTERYTKKLFWIHSLKCVLMGLLFSLAPKVYADNHLDTLANKMIVGDSVFHTWEEEVNGRLQDILKEYNPQSRIGICVFDLTDDKMLYEFGGQELFRPASTQKVLTSITALDILGRDYKFSTKVVYTGEIKDSVLCGDVYVVGGFDPAFDSNDLNQLVKDIANQGIKRIAGRVYYDISMKDGQTVGEGWPRSSRPVLTPLVLNRRTGFMSAFMNRLREEKILVDSLDCKDAIAPDSVTQLVACEHTMEQILYRMLKRSDNLYAEALFYQLAANEVNRHASSEDGAKVIDNMIRVVGKNPEDYKIVDGCGLSYHNAVSPELEIAFLKYAYHNPAIYNLLYQSLPIAGVDGTLRSRMTNGTAFHNVRAKTGTLNGLSSLAGYATASNGHQLAFCIINQGFPRRVYAYQFQKEVCNTLTMKYEQPDHNLFLAHSSDSIQKNVADSTSIKVVARAE